MSFRINTNVNALNTHANAVSNNVDLSKSLGKLSSGLRIQTAADDASGLSIADSLRSQASALGQAIANGNDAIGIIQVADKAMDEQLKVLDTIKAKATQSAQDGQTTQSRQALQADIVRLMEELDNIGNTTSFNGQQLLNGTFSNKEFQIGAYSNQTVKASIGATTSDKIGLTRFESSKLLTKTAAGAISLTFVNVDGVNNVKVQAATISTGLGKGVGALAENINKVSNETGVRATYDVTWTGKTAIAAGEMKDLTINGVIIGDISVKANDENGALINAINAVTDQTGVRASLDKGKLVLTSVDGRAIQAKSKADGATAANNMSAIFGYAAEGKDATSFGTALSTMFIGRLNLVKLDGRDIKMDTGNIGSDLKNWREYGVQATYGYRVAEWLSVGVSGSYDKTQYDLYAIKNIKGSTYGFGMPISISISKGANLNIYGGYQSQRLDGSDLKKGQPIVTLGITAKF